MATIIMESWPKGRLKLPLTTIQVIKLGLDLVTAKKNSDALLEGKTAAIQVKDTALAKEFLKEAEALGVIGRLEED